MLSFPVRAGQLLARRGSVRTAIDGLSSSRSAIGSSSMSATARFSSTSAAAPAPPLLSAEAVVARLRAEHPGYSGGMHAMYSSVLGGITTDPSVMVVPLDDRFVHRGHAVFDTANICEGRMYGLNFHIDRLLASAQKARINVADWPKERLRHVILHTAAASGKRSDAFMRFWLSAGRGLFGIVPELGRPAELYVVCHHYAPKSSSGISEAQVTVPMKPPLLANIKSNNYLLNALTAMEAQDKGGSQGVQVDADGFVMETAVGCIAIVDKDGVLKTPPFDKILRSTTLVRALELAPELVAGGSIRRAVQVGWLASVPDLCSAAGLCSSCESSCLMSVCELLYVC
jgi:4-amino-4-deoxychorismate lyase